MLAPPTTIIASGDAEVIVQVFSGGPKPGGRDPGVHQHQSPESAPIETVTTNNNGCAAFPYLTVGPSYVISATGYTDPNQDTPAQYPIGALTLNETDEVTTGINFDLPTALSGAVQTDYLSGSTYIAYPKHHRRRLPNVVYGGRDPCSSQGHSRGLRTIWRLRRSHNLWRQCGPVQPTKRQRRDTPSTTTTRHLRELVSMHYQHQRTSRG